MEIENLRRLSCLRGKGAFEIMLFLHKGKMRYTDIDIEFVRTYGEKLAGQTLTRRLKALLETNLIEKDENELYSLTERGEHVVRCLFYLMEEE